VAILADPAAVPVPVLQAVDLRKTFVTRRNMLGRSRATVTAVAQASLAVGRGETLGIVGESGSGKSTLARLLLRLVDADEGTVFADGANVSALRGRALRRWRRHVQMVHQDPFSSLDPRMRVRDSIAEPLRIHFPHLSRAERQARVNELLTDVGVDPEAGARRPSGFSGGQLQRIAIARALASEPSVLICDEAVSALDVSIRGQILNLLRDLQNEHGIAIVFISHDLSLVRAIASRMLVMYQGSIVEEGDAESIFARPEHDYTKQLLRSIPVTDPTRRRRQAVPST
jgi:ABC-type oligopeptide transport system ATPase subunit